MRLRDNKDARWEEQLVALLNLRRDKWTSLSISGALKGFLKNRVIDYSLIHIGIEYYEKNVVNQLLEFMNYYTTEILSEAKIFKEYARLASNESENKKDN